MRVEVTISWTVQSRACSQWFFFSSRRRHTRSLCDWSSDVCSSDLAITKSKITSLIFYQEPSHISIFGVCCPISLNDWLLGYCKTCAYPNHIIRIELYFYWWIQCIVNTWCPCLTELSCNILVWHTDVWYLIQSNELSLPFYTNPQLTKCKIYHLYKKTDTLLCMWVHLAIDPYF